MFTILNKQKSNNMPLPTSALIAGGASLISGLTGMSNQHKANRANMQLAKYEWQKNKEMWNMQNAYNTPSAQMQRFKDAGLNKNLMYGQGTHGNATNMPQYQKPKVESIGHPDAGGSMMNAYNAEIAKSQVANIQEQTRLTQAEGVLKSIEAERKGARGKGGKLLDTILQEYDVALKKGSVDKQEQEIINLIQSNKQTIANTQVTQATIDWMKKTGLNPNDSTISKTIEYLSRKTGYTPEQIILTVGGLQVFKAIVPKFNFKK